MLKGRHDKAQDSNYFECTMAAMPGMSEDGKDFEIIQNISNAIPESICRRSRVAGVYSLSNARIFAESHGAR